MGPPTLQARPQVTARETLRSLDFDGPEAADIDGENGWRHAGRAFTRSMARDRWLKWNPGQDRRIEDERFLDHFRRFLADGLELGYRLERFAEVSARLPDPDASARNWIPFFEEVLAGDDCCVVRMFLSPQDHEAFRMSHQPPAGDGLAWHQMLSMVADGLFYELGLVFRPVAISVDESLVSPWYRCEWNDLRLPPQRGIDADSVLVNDTADRLLLLGIEGERTVNPANGAQHAIIRRSDRQKAEHAGLTAWGCGEYAVLALSACIRRAAAALVNRSLCDLYFMRLREWAPDLVAATERVMERDFLVQILRGLLAEEISVRDLSTILGAALELRATIEIDTGKYIVFPPLTNGVLPARDGAAFATLTPPEYVDYIRARLRRYISHKHARGGNTLVVYLMDPRTEDMIRHPQMSAATQQAIRSAVQQELDSLPPTAQAPVILTTMEVRRKLRELVAADFPHLAVVSFQELSPDMNIQPIARISPDF